MTDMSADVLHEPQRQKEARRRGREPPLVPPEGHRPPGPQAPAAGPVEGLTPGG